jgi:GAF domain-containing protein
MTAATLGSAPPRAPEPFTAEARRGGIRDSRPTLEAIDRRRPQLLITERVGAASMAERLRELEALHAAGTAMNSVLVIEEVLRVILTSAIELLRPRGGSILLLEDPDTLVVVCTVGDASGSVTRAPVGDGLAGRVELHRRPVLVTGTAPDGSPAGAESAICVPLVPRGELVGVLELRGAAERNFTDVDVRSAALFADHAAIAIANARLNDTERELSARLDALAPPTRP